jgi:hypothetical protein
MLGLPQARHVFSPTRVWSLTVFLPATCAVEVFISSKVQRFAPVTGFKVEALFMYTVNQPGDQVKLDA